MIIQNQDGTVCYNSFAIKTFYIQPARQAPYAIYASTNSTHALDAILAYYDSYEDAVEGFKALYLAFANKKPVFSFWKVTPPQKDLERTLKESRKGAEPKQ